VKKLCNKAIMLEKGKKISEGLVEKLMDEYTKSSSIQKKFKPITIPEINITLKKILINPYNDGKVYPCRPLIVDIYLESRNFLKNLGIQIMISNDDTDGRVFSTNTKVTNGIDVVIKKGLNKFRLQIDSFNLSSGKYQLGFGIDIPFVKFYFHETNLLNFHVFETVLKNSQVPTLPVYGRVYLKHQWILE